MRAFLQACPRIIFTVRVTLFPSGMLYITNIWWRNKNNMSFYSELNVEHDGECFVSIRWPLDIWRYGPLGIWRYGFGDMDLEIWKIADFGKIWPLTSHNWAKVWPRVKKCTTIREYSPRAIRWLFSFKLYDAYIGNAKGETHSHQPPPPSPCAVEDGEMTSAGEG